MFNTGRERSKMRRLLRAAMPVTPSGSLALRRLSPLLLLAVALVALAVFVVHDSPPAAADHGEAQSLLSATLTTDDLGSGAVGCGNGTSHTCWAAGLESFTYRNESFAFIVRISVDSGTLMAQLSASMHSSQEGYGLRSEGVLVLDGTEFKFADATISRTGVIDDTASWTSTGLSWAAGDEVALELKTLPAPPSGVYVNSIWSADLTVQSFTGGLFLGCTNSETGAECSSALTDPDFAHGGVDRAVTEITLTDGDLGVRLDEDWPTTPYTLHVGAVRLSSTGTTGSFASWDDTGLSWAAGDTVSVRLTVAPVVAIASETGSGTFTVALAEDPGGSVTVTLAKTQYFQSDYGESGHRWNLNAATVSPATLDFTSSDYSDDQTVTVTGNDDDDTCDEQLVILVLVEDSGAPVEGVHVTIDDNDTGDGCGGL